MSGKRPARKTKGKNKDASRSEPARRFSSDTPHQIVYFKRQQKDDADTSTPGRDFLQRSPPKVRILMQATLVAVAAAPPHKFAGGGYWEAMHGEMSGWYEIRADGPGRHHYRLFCLIDLEAEGADSPLLVIITGMDKPFKTVFSDRDYAHVRALGDEYRSRNPRSIE